MYPCRLHCRCMLCVPALHAWLGVWLAGAVQWFPTSSSAAHNLCLGSSMAEGLACRQHSTLLPSGQTHPRGPNSPGQGSLAPCPVRGSQGTCCRPWDALRHKGPCICQDCGAGQLGSAPGCGTGTGFCVFSFKLLMWRCYLTGVCLKAALGFAAAVYSDACSSCADAYTL